MGGLIEALTVVPREDGTYQGSTPNSQMQRTFGGLVAGQSMVAMVDTVPPQYSVHSLHAYFVRPGQPRLPITFEVDRVREGRSFALRRVTGLQGGRVIFMGSASFHVQQAGPVHQEPMVLAPDPSELDPGLARDGGKHESFATIEWPDWDIRRVPEERLQSPQRLVAHDQVWFRNTATLPDDPLFHVCALTYMSDISLLSVAMKPHSNVELEGASLDHALWFLRPFRADDWLLYDQTTPSAGGGRGLTSGRIYDRSGALVATSVQEGLMRLKHSRR